MCLGGEGYLPRLATLGFFSETRRARRDEQAQGEAFTVACTDLFTEIGKMSFQDRETDATECVELEGVGVDSAAQGSEDRLPLTIVP